MSVGPSFLRCDDDACASRLPTLAQAGFRHVEWARHWLDEPVVYRPDDIDRYVDELHSAGLTLASVHGYVTYKPSLADAHFHDVNRSRIDLCDRAGCNVLVLHAPCPTLPDPAIGRQHAVRQIEQLLPHADAVGVRLAVENLMPSHQGDPLVFFDHLLTALPAPAVGLCYDHAHGLLAGQSDLPEQFHDRLLHIHLSDNDLKHDRHLPIGRGKVNFSDFTDQLRTLDYTGAVNLEVVRPERQAMPDFAAETFAAAIALTEKTIQPD
jgi:sugar phosphate isomerase/epimerase